MKKKIKNLLIFFVLLISSTMIIGSIYYYKEYPGQDFDQIVYYAQNGAQTTAPSVINSVIVSCSIPIILLTGLLWLFTIRDSKKNIFLIVKIKKNKHKIQIFPIKPISNHKIIYLVIIFVIAITSVIFGLKIDKYIKNKISSTKIYEEYYVDARENKITFPEQKRNLIIIVAESMENTVLSKANGGQWEYSIIPELENLAIENTNFSNTERIGGAYQTYGTSFSAAGIVALTSGAPLTVGKVMEDNIYSGTGNFLPGLYSLGDVLKENGYNLEIMLGSNATFGGRAQYFTTHGQYKVFDVNYAIQQEKMKDSDRVWWGFEDDKLFKWSKEEITTLAKQDKPFNYIMVTADTHFPDGYLSTSAENKFGMQYENVYAYSSKLINEFIEWIKKQDFYNNTTIVIVGDHLGMQTEFYEANRNEDYERTIFNTIINSVKKAENTTNRHFTSMDMYPTILASIGVEIEGNRIGLGTNLYSGEPTLIETLGYDYFNKEIQKNSTFYNNYLLGRDYYSVKEQN